MTSRRTAGFFFCVLAAAAAPACGGGGKGGQDVSEDPDGVEQDAGGDGAGEGTDAAAEPDAPEDWTFDPIYPACGESVLSALAASMAPGSFALLETAGWDEALLDAGGGHNILQYSDKAVWDPRSCQVLFVGGGHLSLTRFIAYVESSNTWMQMPNPSWWCPPEDENGELDWGCVTHAYEHNAFKADTQDMFFRRFNDANVYRYHVTDPPTSAWTQTADLPEGAASCCCTGLEYFPEMQRLVYVDCSAGDLLLLDLESDVWSPLGGSFVMGPYHNLSSYNPVHGIMIFGGGNGSRDLYRLEAGGATSRIADPPHEIGIGYDDDGDRSILTVDPASGDYLAYWSADGIYGYDAAADAWSRVDVAAPANLYLAAPLSNHGVVMFMGRAPEEIYLYKHVP